MQYRPEIDGLRGLAIIPVVLFHAGFSAFGGGYVGVDVFFVISGYLITRLILAEQSENRFSLIGFYERRVRRIVPALTLVVAACIPFAWHMMLPDPLENFGQSVVATMLSANNVLLALTSGYWNLASEFKPLLHTWSISVEEQFYLLYPLLLLALWPLKRRSALLVVALITLASFASAVWLVERYPSGTFYLLHTRAWELGLGALVAFAERGKAGTGNDLLAGLGLAMIAVPIALFSDMTPHPSYPTLLPVIGTVLLIAFARPGTITAGLLSRPILTGIGLVSYSLYLWHQPLFAFARIRSLEEPGPMVFAALAVLALVLSFLSWKFVEVPFRDRSSVSRARVVQLLVVAWLVLPATGLALHFGQGYPARVFAAQGGEDAGMHISYNERIRDYAASAFPESGSGTKVLVAGNSQARDFVNIALETGLLEDSSLVYRENLDVCGFDRLASADKRLVEAADIVLMPVFDAARHCRAFIESGGMERRNVVFVGPKHFGYNLNAFIAVPEPDRPAARARIFDDFAAANRANAALLPAGRYIDLIGYASDNGAMIRVFDDNGNIISADRVHVTRAGARFFAKQVATHSAFGIFRQGN